MSGLTYLLVCTIDMFLAPALIARLDDIPKTISVPKIEYKPRAASSPYFTGRRDYLTKLRAFFNAESDGPHRRKFFQWKFIPDVGTNLPDGMHTQYVSHTSSNSQIR